MAYVIEDKLGALAAWKAGADEDQRVAMKKWLKALRAGPECSYHHVLHHRGRRRPLFAAQVPDARCVVTYWWSDAPTRFVRISSVVPIYVVPD